MSVVNELRINQALLAPVLVEGDEVKKVRIFHLGRKAEDPQNAAPFRGSTVQAWPKDVTPRWRQQGMSGLGGRPEASKMMMVEALN